jgi:hypothetical protein
MSHLVGLLVLAMCGAGAAGRTVPPGDSADDLARAILDPATTDAEREALLKAHPAPSADLVAALARGLGGDVKEEYRRIPWVWRVAIAAGRRNDPDELRRLLSVALPEEAEPLEHWQAVVLGGGVINGVSQAGAWPGDRIEGILRDDGALLKRWRRALELAATMADDEAVPNGTRYDALRMIGLEPWDRRGAQIVRYLAGGVDPELQQGAIGALGDLRSPEATRALVSGLPRYTPSNRRLAVDALLRDDERRDALLDLLEAGRIPATELSDAQVRLLLDPARNQSHERARKLLAR